MTTVARRIATRPRPKVRRAMRNSKPYCVVSRPSAESRVSGASSVPNLRLPYVPSPSLYSSCCDTTTQTSIKPKVAASSTTKACSRSESGTGREVETDDAALVTLDSEIVSVPGKLSAPKAKAAKRAALLLSSETMPIARSGDSRSPGAARLPSANDSLGFSRVVRLPDTRVVRLSTPSVRLAMRSRRQGWSGGPGGG